KQEKRKKVLEETTIKNEEVLKYEKELAKAEVAKLQTLVKEKQQGAISLIMSLIA
ncbi:MAG: hypothetical protein HXL16_00410, partial [Peptostreptococcaceae bacterium]|nr:hypothetical protein [Peptostreptococcaceae bacterium]